MGIIEAVNLAQETTLEELVKLAPKDGLFLEFGVYQGYTINRIADSTPNLVFGFDSFKGLPEDWYMHEKGHFACELPVDIRGNVSLVPGWFNETLPLFLSNVKNNISFIHIDCDLYSSTKTVFDNVKNRLNNECIIVFDELYGYDGWGQHEYKAFNEFLEETKFKWECVGKYSQHQAGFRIYV